jgi:hypothetical protein
MPLDRQRPPPRERTFGELFPWRNMRRAVMLVLLIVAILTIKRSTGGFLTRVGALWGTPGAASARAPVPGQSGAGQDARRPFSPGGVGVRVRLGPGLAPLSPSTDRR